MEYSDLKIMVIGDFITGKTNFIKRWTKNVFTEDYIPTIISDDEHKKIEIDGKAYEIHLIEFPRIEPNIIKTYINNFDGFIFLSDASSEETLYHCLNKKKILKSKNFLDEEIMPMILVKNKCDLLSEKDENTESKLKEFAKENQFLEGFLASAKTGENVNESIEFLIKEIIKTIEIRKKINEGEMEEDIDISDIKFENLEKNVLKVFLSKEEDGEYSEYSSEINIDELKAKYQILNQIENVNELINAFKEAIEQKKAKINLYLKKLLIQIGFQFINILGTEIEITIELAYEKIETKEDLEKKIINRLIKMMNEKEGDKMKKISD